MERMSSRGILKTLFILFFLILHSCGPAQEGEDNTVPGDGIGVPPPTFGNDTPPTRLYKINSIALSNPTASPSLIKTPTLLVSGVAIGDVVTIYSDQNCATQIYQETVTTMNTALITLNTLNIGTYNFYAKKNRTDETLESDCFDSNLTYEVIFSIPTVTITSYPDITAANQNNYTMVGSCSEEGRDVNLLLEALAVTVTCVGGTWISSGMDVSVQPDSPTFVLTASQTDIGGNTGTVSENVIKNTVVPQVSLNTPDNIGLLNQTSYSLSGTCTENGTDVTVSIDTINLTLNCTGGTWSTGVVDTSALADNPALPITVDHSTATTINTTVVKDTTVVNVSINNPVDITNANETTYSVSGACTENGVAVDVTIGTITVNRTCNSGSWSSGLVDVSTLADSPTILISVDHSTANATANVEKNTATPSVFSLSAPTSLSTSVTLGWQLSNPGPFTINDYQINYRQNGTSTWLTFDDGTSTEFNSIVTGLSPSTTYDFRVRAVYDTSNFTEWSNIATGETKPDDPLFASPYAAMNVGGAVETKIVALYDNTTVTLNGVEIAGSPLSKGTTATVATAQFDIVDADKAIYTAGRRGTTGAGANRKANIVWQPTAWAGKSFSFNATRNDPQQLQVYATENTTIEVKNGATVLASATITKGNGSVLSWSQFGSFQVVSTGTVLAFHSSGDPAANYYIDPKPLLPGSQELIGFPSRSMRITADFDATNYNIIHSNSVTASGSLNKTDVVNVNSQGATTSFFQGESMLLSADQNLSGASFADANGLCAAPFLPTSLMRKNYAVNINSDYVAFASKQAGTIEVRDSSDTVIETLTLTRTGANTNAPYRARRGTTTEGTRFFSTVPVAAWYQPNNDFGGGDEDETILYGSDN